MAKNIPYHWEGVILSGETISGIINAPNIALAKTALRKQGIVTRKLFKKRESLFNRYNSSIKPADITLFARQLATLFKAGIPLMRSFEIMEQGSPKLRMKILINSIGNDVGAGLMLAQALRKHPASFNTLFCSMVDAGEQSGSLDIMLDKVAIHKEKMARVKKQIQKALAYPLAVMLIGVVISSCFLIGVIPKFQSLFSDFGAELPLLTQWVINLSNLLNACWPGIFFIMGITAYGLVHMHRHYPEVTQMNHRLVLKIPIIGAVLKNASIARFARTLSITFAAGLPLTDALNAVACASGNSLYTQATYQIQKQISNGQTLQQAIQNTKLFPSLVTQLIAIGEESGTLEQMLCKIGDFYENDVDNAVEMLGSLLEPLIMTILGLLVGGLVIAMYLPILKLGTVV